jgi:hypothetical protein
MSVENQERLSLVTNSTQIIIFSNVLAISNLRKIPICQISGGIYDFTKGLYVETISGLEENELNERLRTCLDKE